MAAPKLRQLHHGTQAMYTTGGCRCDDCKLAHSKANLKCVKTRARKLKEAGYVPAYVKINDFEINVIIGYGKHSTYDLPDKPPIQTKLSFR